MSRCFDEGRWAYTKGNHTQAKQWSNKGNQHKERMEKLNEKASEWIFTGMFLLHPLPSDAGSRLTGLCQKTTEFVNHLPLVHTALRPHHRETTHVKSTFTACTSRKLSIMQNAVSKELKRGVTQRSVLSSAKDSTLRTVMPKSNLQSSNIYRRRGFL